MKMPIKTNNIIFALVTSLFIAATLTGCSDDEQSGISKKTQIHFDHAHGSEVSDLIKHKFEHKFAEQCVQREIQNSVNKADERKRFAKPCLCIATRIMRDLTAVEAEKFLIEKKSTQSLKMSFDEAAYFCLQNKAQAKSPVLFGRK